MACGKKHKPFILKHKAHISKYVPCIFCLFKFLINSNLQNLPKIIYLFGFQTFAEKLHGTLPKRILMHSRSFGSS